MVAPRKTFLQTYGPYIAPVLTFLFGFGINYINTTNKVEQLTAAVTSLTAEVRENNNANGRLGNRVTALETKVFGQPQQFAFNTPINNNP